MYLVSNVVQTKASHLMELRLPDVNTSDEVDILGTPSTRIRNLTDVSHWSVLDHVFGKATGVGMSATGSEQDYSYKTDSKIWRENQDFGRQNNSMSQPHLKSTPIGTNTTNVTTSQFNLIPIRM